MHKFPLAALLIPLLLLGCGGDDAVAPADIVVTGQWVGAGGSGSGSFGIEVSLNETGGAVTGNGRFVANAQTVAAFSLTGTHTHPQVAFTIVTSGFEDTLFTGRFTTNNRIEGELNGSGFEGLALTIDRTEGTQ